VFHINPTFPPFFSSMVAYIWVLSSKFRNEKVYDFFVPKHLWNAFLKFTKIWNKLFSYYILECIFQSLKPQFSDATISRGYSECAFKLQEENQQPNNTVVKENGQNKMSRGKTDVSKLMGMQLANKGVQEAKTHDKSNYFGFKNFWSPGDHLTRVPLIICKVIYFIILCF